MFKLIDEYFCKEIAKIAELIKSTNENCSSEIQSLIDDIYSNIPEKKRISYGRYSIIKHFGIEFYPELNKQNIDVFSLGKSLYNDSKIDLFIRSLGIQLITLYGEEHYELKSVIPEIEKAAMDDEWIVRECSAGFVRKLIKAYPQEMKKIYLDWTKSENAMLRRFSSESIRPVADNKWFKKNPDFCFDIISNLYKEKDVYPRTSVGNNLSDWARTDKERVFKIIEQLVKSEDKNSYWIAYRACRNLVKTEKNRVMDILGVDEYKYKTRVHYRDKS